jgi:hypothetical protein
LQPTTSLADQEWIAFQGVDKNVWLVHPDGNGKMPITSDASGEDLIYRSLKWSPDGTYLAFIKQSKGKASLLSLDLRTGKIAVLVESVPAFNWDISRAYDWSPDGTRIVVETESVVNYENNPAGEAVNEGLLILDIKTKQLELLISPEPAHYLYGPDWSPTGEMIGYNACIPGMELDACQYQIVAADGRGVFISITGESSYFYSPAMWTPGGASLFYGECEVTNPETCVNPRTIIKDVKGNQISVINFAEVQPGNSSSPDEEWIAHYYEARHAASAVGEEILDWLGARQMILIRTHEGKIYVIDQGADKRTLIGEGSEGAVRP